MTRHVTVVVVGDAFFYYRMSKWLALGVVPDLYKKEEASGTKSLEVRFPLARIQIMHCMPVKHRRSELLEKDIINQSVVSTLERQLDTRNKHPFWKVVSTTIFSICCFE
jgi:hypothetical protein